MDEETVQYSFTGDVSSLRQATQAAIGLLDKYGQKIGSLVSNNLFKKSSKSFKESAASVKQSLQAVSEAFAKSSSQAKSFNNHLNVLSGTSDLLKKTLGALTGVKFGDWIAQGTKESIKFVENLNLFKVALGESTDAGLKFVDSMSELYGMDPSNLYRYAGYFYQLTDAIGMADSSSSVLSLSLTKASNDIASLFNVDIETVVNNLASGMQGMTRAVRKYGIDIRAVTLQQTALNYGITQQVETMSEADRQALRYITMMEQIKNATKQTVDSTVQVSGVMGDFARNIETPANQLRIWREQVSQLGRAVGNFLIPMLSKLLPILNGVIMAIRTVLSFLFALTGFKMDFGGTTTGASEQAEAITGIGTAAGGASKALKELKKTLAPLDEINLLNAPNESSGGRGGGGATEGLMNPALEEAIKGMSLSLEDIEMKANKVRDSLLKFFGFNYVEVFNPDTGEYEKKLQWFADQFRTNLIDKFPQWSQTINALFDNWSSIIESFKGVFRSLGDVVDSVKKKIKEFMDSLNLDEKVSSGISNLTTNLNTLSSWISEHKDQIANFILSLGAVVVAFRAFRLIKGYLAPILGLGAKILPLASSLLELIAPIAAVVATIALLYTNSESFATSFQNLFQTIVASLSPIAESVKTLVQRIWESLQSLWQEHLQPMVQAVGDALAPILDALSVLWETLSTIFQSIMDMLGTLWETVVSPILGAIAQAIAALMSVIQTLWEEVIGPVIENVLKSLPDLFDKIIKPVLENVSAIIAGLIEIILALWSNVLAPIIQWLVTVLGPSIRNVINTIWNYISNIVQSIAKIINGLIQIIRGVVDFIAGVFTRDWERAWTGIKEIMAGIWNSIAGIFETVINGIIGALNMVISLIWSTAQSFVNSILNTINSVGSWLGFSINLQWGSPPPAIGYISVPKVELASGGVVTGPTNALIGEGSYDEAVIPLGNSPQMRDFVDQIAGRINSTEQVGLLREQNQLLRQLLERSGNSIGIKDLSNTITRIQRQEARAGGY